MKRRGFLQSLLVAAGMKPQTPKILATKVTNVTSLSISSIGSVSGSKLTSGTIHANAISSISLFNPDGSYVGKVPIW